MAKGKQRDVRKEQQWRQRFRQWRASGLTVRAFCEERGLSEPSFYAWRRVLAERGAEERGAEASVFVPVEVVSELPLGVAARPPLELVVSERRLVRVHPGFDAATLRQLLAVLEEKPC